MEARIKKCVNLLKKIHCDTFLVSNPLNISYLANFPEAQGYLLLTFNEVIYFTSFLYKQAAKQLSCWQVITNQPGQDIFTLIAQKIKRLKSKRVGFESKHLPFLEYKTLNENLAKAEISLIATEDFIERMRMIKDVEEISLIKKSVSITGEAFEFTEEIFDGEMSEKDLAIEIERFLRLKGDNQIAFESIVACGRNTIFPHHRSGREKIGNKFFLIDLGSKYYGYCADLTRVFFGSKIPLLFKEVYNTILRAQEAAIAKIKEGVKAANVDQAARQIIERKSWGKYFGHGLGHGVGLAVHELPRIGPKSEDILKENMIVTIEPAIYFQNKFGIRIEDMVLVKSKKGEVISGNVYR